MKVIKFWLLKMLLKSFCEKDMDQFEMWQVDTTYGPVFISITRETNYPNAYEKMQ